MEWSNISLYNSNALPNLLQIEQQDKNVNRIMLNIDQTLTLYGVILLTWNYWHIGHDNNTQTSLKFIEYCKNNWKETYKPCLLLPNKNAIGCMT
jgi:hypothetical protein